jgi:hypothetical protein
MELCLCLGLKCAARVKIGNGAPQCQCLICFRDWDCGHAFFEIWNVFSFVARYHNLIPGNWDIKRGFEERMNQHVRQFHEQEHTVQAI